MDYRINGFAFNRDNLAGMDAMERAGINRFLCGRERAINTVTTRALTCAGGPFDGQVIELEEGHNCSAPFTVGAWAGRYEAVINTTGAQWIGTGTGPALENLQTVAPIARGAQKATATLGKGFTQMADLLASLTDDTARELVTVDVRTYETGATSHDTKEIITPTVMAVFKIGRATYRVLNTPEAIEAFRAKLLKAKKWFSDAMLAKAGPRRAEVTAPPAAATVAAVLATAQAIAKAAQVEAPAREPASVCAQGDASGAGDAPAMGYTNATPAQASDGAQGSTGGPGAPVAPAAGPAGGDDEQPDSDAPADIPAAAMLGDIPQSLARSAYSGTSFSPERRGDNARTEYAQTLAEDYKHFHAQAVKGGTLDQLAAEFARYRAGMASRYRAYLASSSRCVSSFIAGPSNFPAARMNKRADIAHRRLGEYLDGRTHAMRAVVRNLRPDLRPIMAGDADAAERLALEIAQAERLQDNMKRVNATIRKHAKAGAVHQVAALMELGYTEGQAVEILKPDFCGRVGFADYRLTNNGANIRRMRARLEQIERNKATPVQEVAGADGVRLEDDAPANRVRLYFPGKPAADVRDELKAKGFRWSPKAGAWQAYRNSWSMQTAQRLAGVSLASKPAAPALQAENEAPGPCVSVQSTAPGPCVSVQTTAPGPCVSAVKPGSWAAWEGEIVNRVQSAFDLTHGDAQDIVDAQPFKLAQGWARGTSGADMAAQLCEFFLAQAAAQPSGRTLQDLDGHEIAVSWEAALTEAVKAGCAMCWVSERYKQNEAPAAPAAVRTSLHARRFIPEVGPRVVGKSGAWEAWIYRDKLGRDSAVFYLGKSAKPAKHFYCKNRADALASVRRWATAADKAAAENASQIAARRAELAKPHGLKVGAVLVHSWGYDQTNIDYYQVTKLIGARMVEFRPIEGERHRTGDMSGVCVPCPGQFTGDARRAKVGAGDRVKVGSLGSASPLEIVGSLPGGAPIYRKHGFSEYA